MNWNDFFKCSCWQRHLTLNIFTRGENPRFFKKTKKKTNAIFPFWSKTPQRFYFKFCKRKIVPKNYPFLKKTKKLISSTQFYHFGAKRLIRFCPLKTNSVLNMFSLLIAAHSLWQEDEDVKDFYVFYAFLDYAEAFLIAKSSKTMKYCLCCLLSALFQARLRLHYRTYNCLRQIYFLFCH